MNKHVGLLDKMTQFKGIKSDFARRVNELAASVKCQPQKQNDKKL